MTTHKSLLSRMPDHKGHFGIFGGRYVAETLMPMLLRIENAYKKISNNPNFVTEHKYYLQHYVGRPSPLYFAANLTKKLNGAKIYFKRDELNHTGSHKINNALGQILLAKHMGITEIIAETGAGQHGVACATVCALFNMSCKIFMGAKDIARQELNVLRMKLLGANIIPVESGAASLKEAMNEALRYWVSQIDNVFYIIGTVAGPHPYPMMVRNFQSVIGKEVADQMQYMEGRNPDTLIACVGGGSNAMGLFYYFIDQPTVILYGVEAAGKGLDSNKHAASISGGQPGVLHGNCTFLLQNNDGQINEAHSISAGLDYPGIGPEHAYLHSIGRAKYVSITDQEALVAFQLCSQTEGIIPALEPAHALSFVFKLAPKLSKDNLLVVNLCGRGDKDIYNIQDLLKTS